MIRYGLIAAASALVFVLGFQLARGVASEQSRSQESGSPRPEPLPTSDGSGVAGGVVSNNAPTVAMPVVRIVRRAPTPYERAVLESPREFFAMKMALQEQLVADKHLARECFDGEDLVDRTTLEYSWWVESTRTHAIASDPRFVQEFDDETLPTRVTSCLEQALDRQLEALAHGRQSFPRFRGEVLFRLTFRSRAL